jgi:poly(A) polymerase
MTEPRVFARAEHSISRRDIDADALKVLYRLRQAGHVAYLVGGSVRDLLLGRRPKDFDIGTSAHPYQVKKLFRNCWIIGRRFRLAHVRFGPKVIEVATFRRPMEPGEEIVQDGVPAPPIDGPADAALVDSAGNAPPDGARPSGTIGLLHRDNTFGTPEEDAFRRDFTINALFYDIATFSIIDYVHGMEDLAAGIVRSIGDPDVRFREDPVRMLRAIALGARLDFSIDRPVLDAIGRLRHEITRSSPARLLEEYYKILRSGTAEKTFRNLAEVGLLEPISAELHRGAGEPLWRSLAALDLFRAKFVSVPETFSNPVLLGSLLVPLERSTQPERPDARSTPPARLPAAPAEGASLQRAGPRLGELPLARRDLERLGQIRALQRRLHDLSAAPRAQRALLQRGVFREALSWLEIHGEAPDVVEHWIKVLAGGGGDDQPGGADKPPPFRRRRRRRRYTAPHER